ncbi:hypothetical protein D3C84_931080 [compost metagenome]
MSESDVVLDGQPNGSVVGYFAGGEYQCRFTQGSDFGLSGVVVEVWRGQQLLESTLVSEKLIKYPIAFGQRSNVEQKATCNGECGHQLTDAETGLARQLIKDAPSE